MLKENINGHKIELYDSIDELPIERFYFFNRQILMDSGVGSTMDDISARGGKLIRLTKTDPDKAGIEAMNMIGAIANCIQNINPEMGAFLALVKTVNGEPWTDLSNEGVQAFQETIKTAKRTTILDLVKKIRRAIRSEMSIFFKTGNGSEAKEYYQKLKQKLILQMKGVQGQEIQEDMKTLDEAMMQMDSVIPYLGENGVQVKDIIGGKEAIAMVTKYIGKDAKDMSVLEFYTVVEMIRKEVQKNKKQ